MSNVTDLIVTCGIGDKGASEINNYKQDDCILNLVSVSDPKLPDSWYGGTKVLQCEMYIGAVNWLDLGEFVVYLRSIEWQYPECVQVIAKGEDDLQFETINVFPDLANRPITGLALRISNGVEMIEIGPIRDFNKDVYNRMGEIIPFVSESDSGHFSIELTENNIALLVVEVHRMISLERLIKIFREIYGSSNPDR